jgi:hypothetical protein
MMFGFMSAVIALYWQNVSQKMFGNYCCQMCCVVSARWSACGYLVGTWGVPGGYLVGTSNIELKAKHLGMFHPYETVW